MFATPGASSLRVLATARWRSVAGLVIMLVAIGESARRLDNPSELPVIGLLALVMVIGWFVQLGPHTAVGVWVLGSAASVLTLLHGSGGLIGVIAAIVFAASRLPVRRAALAAGILSGAYLLADGVATRWSPPLGLAFTGLGLAFAYTVTTSVRRVREERERAEALLIELQETRAWEIERAAVAERTRIAREIHDVLAHTLSALAVQLVGTRMLLEQRRSDPAAIVAVERAHRLASAGLAEARRAVGTLRGDGLPGPEGLLRLANEFEAATGTPAQCEVRGEPVQLPLDARLALYRTAQEALTNIRKHAPEASSVAMYLRYCAEGVELLVEDVAPGGGPICTSATSGYGLLGMRERAELLGGTLETRALPSGFWVRLWLPVPR